MASVGTIVRPNPPERVAYPQPIQKWAKHARKRCQACRAPLQGKYWLLDPWTWTCLGCGSDALDRNAVIS